MAIQPNQKKNQSLGLTGSNLFSWQSRPATTPVGRQDGAPIRDMSSYSSRPARQPSGANAPRPQQGAMPKTPGVANRAGVPKAPSLGDPAMQFANRQAELYGASPNASSIMQNEFAGQGKMPNDMGIYGAPGSANRNAAEDAYRNFQGPSISKGPYTPTPGINPRDNMQLLSGMARVPDDASKQDPQDWQVDPLYETIKKNFGEHPDYPGYREYRDNYLKDNYLKTPKPGDRPMTFSEYQEDLRVEELQKKWRDEAKRERDGKQPPVPAATPPVQSTQEPQAKQEPKLSQTPYGWQYDDQAKEILGNIDNAIRSAHEDRNRRIVPFPKNFDNAPPQPPKNQAFDLAKAGAPLPMADQDMLEQTQSPWKPEFEQKVAKQWQDAYSSPTPAPADSTLNQEEQRWKSMGVSPAELEKLRSGQMSQTEWESIKNRAAQGKADPLSVVSPEQRAQIEAGRSVSRGLAVPDGMYGPPQAGQEKRLPPSVPGLTPEQQEQFDANVEMDRELARKRAAEDAGNLAYTGAINDGFSGPENRQADYYGQRRASMDAMNKRLDEGGGLQYREASTGFGTPEQGAQAAADFRAMGAADQARNQRIKDESERLYESTRAERDARNAAQVGQGLNPEQVQKGTSKLAGEFAAITKQRVAPGLKFTDYVQQQIDSGRTDISPDAISVIEKNYGVQFNKTPPQRSGPTAPAPSALDLARKKAADTRAARGMEEAQQQGRERRIQQAAAQAAYRADAAALIAQGMTPQQANQALARQKAMDDFYNANVAMQTAEAQGQIGAAGLQAQADMYRSSMQFLDNTADRKERSAQRIYEQQQAENQAMMQIEQQASQLPGDPRDPNTPAGRYAATQRALRLGVQPPNPIQDAKNTPADQRTSSQTNAIVDTAIEQLKASQGFDPNSNTAIITGVRKLKESGLSPQEQIKGISKLTGKDMSIKSNSTMAIRAIMEDISARATANSQNSLTGKDYAREFASGAADYTEALRALKEGSGMSDQEFAAILKENPIGQYLNQQQGRGLTGAAFGPLLGPIIDSFL